VKVDVNAEGDGLSVESFDADLTIDTNWEDALSEQERDD